MPYQVFGVRVGALALTMAWIRSAMTRSGFDISAIFASTSLSPSALPERARLRSLRVSLIAAFSSAVNNPDPLLVVLRGDVFAASFGLIVVPPAESQANPRERGLVISIAGSYRRGLRHHVLKWVVRFLDAENPGNGTRQVPIPLPEQGHQCWDQQHSHNGRIQEDAEAQTGGEHLDVRLRPRRERQKCQEENQRGAGDQAAGATHALNHGAIGRSPAVVFLADARQDEHLVVHRESEEEGEDHDRQPAGYRA